MRMQKRKSENLKEESSDELGIFPEGQNQGWSPVSTHSCGNMVSSAFERTSRKAGKNPDSH